MTGPARKHDRKRRLGVIVVLFAFTVLWMRSEASASCGDYLLHGWPTHSGVTGVGGSADAQDPAESQVHESRSGDSMTREPVNAPQPGSPCASGRCHSLPAWPPANHPGRLVAWKHTATIDMLIGSRSGDRLIDWAFPANGSLPLEPCLAVDVPPPRHS
jgi:hypothetical protein